MDGPVMTRKERLTHAFIAQENWSDMINEILAEDVSRTGKAFLHSDAVKQAVREFELALVEVAHGHYTERDLDHLVRREPDEGFAERHQQFRTLFQSTLATALTKRLLNPNGSPEEDQEG